MRHKSLPLPWELKEMSEDGFFKGYANTRKKDYYGDIIKEGAFARTIEHHNGKFPLLWFHDPRIPIGLSKSMREDGHGLFIEGQLDLDIEEGRRIRSGMLKGYIDRMSIGYDTLRESFDKAQNARILEEVKLWEVSMITKNFAANDEALVTGVKGVIGLRDTDADPDLIRAAIKNLQALLERKEAGREPPPTAQDAPNHAGGSEYSTLRQIEELKALIRVA